MAERDKNAPLAESRSTDLSILKLYQCKFHDSKHHVFHALLSVIGGRSAGIACILVDSLVLNTLDIKQVKMLAGGAEAITLAGHSDIRLPLNANMFLVR